MYVCVCLFACIFDDAQILNGAMHDVTRKKRKGRNEGRVFQDFPSSFVLLDDCSACERTASLRCIHKREKFHGNDDKSVCNQTTHIYRLLIIKDFV
jgi:hypothetical protein